MNGKIEVILGPMYASKTSTLISRAERYEIAKKKCLIIKYSGDTRYSFNNVATHNQREFRAVPCANLSDVEDMVNEYEIILIDEGQFFSGLAKFCDTLANRGKIVIVAALDGDFMRQPFGEIPQLIPLAEEVMKLKAVCSLCFQDGHFTKRITADKEIKIIGGTEVYQAVCRNCYFK
jgi:thymidine kinase